ncbi:hypothetical protein [[Kitasatospora] papulosa]|uniref:hypothetical protein n=1 Tax=[Kitasatospora] papulosa TaxID=1464011 RepID=UPI00364407C8
MTTAISLPLDSDLANCLDDLTAVHTGIDQIRAGIHTLATTTLTPDQTQTILSTLAGSPDGTDVLTALAHLIQHLATPTTNPALRDLPAEQRKLAQLHGETAVFALTAPDLHQHAAEAAAAIDGI